MLLGIFLICEIFFGLKSKEILVGYRLFNLDIFKYERIKLILSNILKNILLKIKQVYLIFNIPQNQDRVMYSYKNSGQIVVAIGVYQFDLNEGLISHKEGFGDRTISYQTLEINL